MNALTPTTRAGAGSLAPQTWAEAMQFAEMLSKSTMVPKDFIGKPGNIMIAIQWANEIGLGPLQAIQSIAVINGRPTLWGDAAIALVRGHPACEWIKEGVEGEGDARAGYCETKRRGALQPERRSFSIADAKKAGLWGKPGPWQQYAERMLQLRARGFTLRDVYPDALRGVITAEEAADIPVEPKDVPNLAAERSITRPTRTLTDEVAAARVTLPVIAPTGTLHQVPKERWLAAVGKALGGLESVAAVQGWCEAMRPNMNAVRAIDDALAHQAEQLAEGRALDLAGPPEPEPDANGIDDDPVPV
jgi:hypothetical protein